MRIALGLEYDGAAFCGWQTQPSGCGVQDRLQGALSKFAATPVEVIAAGRTDAGVHATAQVVHFDTEVTRDAQSWVRGTNTYLDAAARVLWAQHVDAEFHARFSAVSRTYHYLLMNEPVAPALLRQRAGWFHRPLTLAPMQEGARTLLGAHDFSAFRDAECQAKSPVRTLTASQVEQRGNLFVFRFSANAFLHHMIRNIVGALVYVGCGREPSSWIAELLEARDRKLSAPTFAPDGLYLTRVDYGPEHELPAFRDSIPFVAAP
jgi:tRNA pseudouridine38-40 synthase